jgi:hypothetical protein
MSVSRILVTVTFAIGVVTASGACGKKIDRAKAEKGIKDALTSSYGVPVSKVSCPDDVEPEKGGVFHCDATFEGDVVVSIKVEQTDDEGTVTFGPAHPVFAATKIADHIVASFKSEGKDIAVDCGKGVHEFQTPGTIPCTVTDPTGTATRVNVKVDGEGNVDFEEPAAAAPTPPAPTAPVAPAGTTPAAPARTAPVVPATP